MIEADRSGKTRFLVLHDYGMGGLWWWIWAESADEIVTTLAEAEVVTDPEMLGRAAEWELDELDLGDVDGDPALVSMRKEREEQRGQPGFGVLAGRQQVFLRMEDDGHNYLVDIGADGRQVRQVRFGEDGTLYRSSVDDWPINPPIDLHDPQYVPLEVQEREFEEAWRQAVPDPDHED